MERCLLGKEGEKKALEYLLKRGYRLIEKNWRCHHFEIDLIMSDGKNVRFIEVRSRKEPLMIEPYLTVDIAKRHRIVSAASSYILQHKIDAEAKFDIVSVIFTHAGCRIEYIPDAFCLLDRFL